MVGQTFAINQIKASIRGGLGVGSPTAKEFAHLANPYSYAGNNSVTYSDPTGNLREDNFAEVTGGWTFSQGLEHNLTGQVTPTVSEIIAQKMFTSLEGSAFASTAVGGAILSAGLPSKKGKSGNSSGGQQTTKSDVYAVSARVSPKARRHILEGEIVLDGNGSVLKSSGGHMRPANPRKSEFPKMWDGNQILRNVQSIGNDSSLPWSRSRNGNWAVTGVRDGINMTTILAPNGRDVTTGHPGVPYR